MACESTEKEKVPRWSLDHTKPLRFCHLDRPELDLLLLRRCGDGDLLLLTGDLDLRRLRGGGGVRLLNRERRGESTLYRRLGGEGPL